MLFENKDHFIKTLYREMSKKGDVPTLGNSAWKTIAVMDLEQEHFDLTQAILDDAALTQKVLRAANSPMYARFGQNVTTVTQAIMLLGYEKIGHLALSLKVTGSLLETAKGQDLEVQTALHQCVMAGTLTRHLAKSIYAPNAEEAGVCGLLYGIGKVMVMLHMPTTWRTVDAYAQQHRLSDNEALSALLGMDGPEISYEVAKHWSLPPGVVDVLGVRQLPETSASVALSHVQWLSQIVQTADALNQKLASYRYAPKESEVQVFSLEFCERLGMHRADFCGAVQSALTEEQLNPLVRHAGTRQGGSTSPYASGHSLLTNLYALRATLKVEARKHSARSLMAVAAEALHSIFKARRTAMMLKNSERGVLEVRSVLGAEGGKALQGFSLEIGYAPDAFHLAIARNIPLLVSHAKGLKDSGKLPADYVTRVPEAPPFLLLPLSAQAGPLGMLYLDWPADAKVPSLSEEEKACLVSIRDILVDALEALEPTPLAV